MTCRGSERRRVRPYPPALDANIPRVATSSVARRGDQNYAIPPAVAGVSSCRRGIKSAWAYSAPNYAANHAVGWLLRADAASNSSRI